MGGQDTFSGRNVENNYDEGAYDTGNVKHANSHNGNY